MLDSRKSSNIGVENTIYLPLKKENETVSLDAAAPDRLGSHFKEMFDLSLKARCS